MPRTHLNLIAGGLAIVPRKRRAAGRDDHVGFRAVVVRGTDLVAGDLAAVAAARWRCIIPSTTMCLSSRSTTRCCDTLVAPAPLALRLAEIDALSRLPSLRHVIGLWRAPEQVASSAPWRRQQETLTDVYLFGEAGLFGGPPGGRWRAGADHARSASARRARFRVSSIAGEIFLTPKGTLALRGPMVPIARLRAAGAAERLPVAQPPRDFVDTGYAARIDRATGAICITAPPAGIMAVGGYRFPAQDLQEWARRLGQGALLTALPDRLSGHRLAGRAQDNARAREALTELGLNPLMVEAFRDRASPTDQIRQSFVDAALRPAN